MEKAKRNLLNYQQKCYKNYGSSIGLPVPYTYPDGNPIKPLPPIQTHMGGLMIIGAYPSARFESRPSRLKPGKHRLVPVADNLEPFGCERYFDGMHVRALASADGLKKYLLDSIPISFDQCWVTDTVKVFLYKDNHVKSCGDIFPNFKVPQPRNDFAVLAQKSLLWLAEECELCKPKLIVTLGQEVAQVVSNRLSASSKKLFTNDILSSTILGSYPTIFLPHPDACRRDKKWRAKMQEFNATIKNYLVSN
jgi:uracil-DNA glycosylase